MKLDTEPRIEAGPSFMFSLKAILRTTAQAVNALTDGFVSLTSKFPNGFFTPVQQGGGFGQATNKVFIGWSGLKLKATVETTDLGGFVMNNASDEVTLLTSGSTKTLTISDGGASGANVALIGNGAVTPGKTLRVNSGNLEIVNSAYSAVIAKLEDSGVLQAGSGYRCKQGSTGSVGANQFNLNWTGAAAQLWVDGSNVGSISLTSDERVKKQIKSLAADRAAYLRIRPISFRYRDIGIFEDQDGPDGEFWGFSAQNLLTCVPRAVQGSPTAILEDGTPQPMGVIDRPILAQTVLQVQQLIKTTEAQAATIAALRSELDILKGA